MRSAIYTGWVHHVRHAPRAHAFRYRVFMPYLDLAELDEVVAARREESPEVIDDARAFGVPYDLLRAIELAGGDTGRATKHDEVRLLPGHVHFIYTLAAAHDDTVNPSTTHTTRPGDIEWL